MSLMASLTASPEATLMATAIIVVAFILPILSVFVLLRLSIALPSSFS